MSSVFIQIGHFLLKFVGSIFLKEVYLRSRFEKSLDLQISSLVGYLKKISAFPVDEICFREIVHDKLCLDKSVEQIENGLERGFAKPWLNCVSNN